MPYIAPNSTVEFFGNLGLNDNYDDSLYFASESAKNAYFTATQKLATCVSMTYTREQRGYIRVELNIGDIIGASYMRYKNTNFENKWFYAFVKNVEYINNKCTQVNFELDPLMTWMGTFALNECFIERQHTIHDYIGSNVADERLDTGEYVCQGTSKTERFNDYSIVVFQASNEAGEPIGLLFGGIFSGLYMYYAEDEHGEPETVENSVGAIKDYLERMITGHRSDEIIAIQMLPKHFIPDRHSGSSSPTLDRFSITKPYTNFSYPAPVGETNTYTPRNKKLFTYPYNFLLVYNSEGQYAEYKYEYFNSVPDTESTGQAWFTLRGNCNIRSEISLIPEGYRGIQLDIAQRLSITNFPMCSWGVDTYRAYLAQVESSMPFKDIAFSAQAGIGLLTGNPFMSLGAIAGKVGSVYSLLAQESIHPSIPNQVRGIQGQDLMLALKTKDFYFYRMCINKSYAIMLDDYFDQYGYAIREHGIPNMNARPYWTYVKTVGCSVEGNIPADDASAIEKIFNNGIRFWKNHTQIGNYSLNNAPND